MYPTKNENIEARGYILGVLHSAEILQNEEKEPFLAQKLLNELLDGKMRFVFIKRLAKLHKIDIDWKDLNITIKRTD